MKLPNCDREQEVVDALRSGRWTSAWGDELRQHAEDCAVCGEVAFAAQEFQREAELARTELQHPGTRLPSAGLVWWKAQLAARRAAEQRAAAPMVLVERVAIVLGVLAALGLGIWKWSIVVWIFRTGTLSSTPHYAAIPDYSFAGQWLRWLGQPWTGQPSTLLLVATAAIFFTLMAFAAYVVWRED
jgi:hypothetical protein